MSRRRPWRPSDGAGVAGCDVCGGVPGLEVDRAALRPSVAPWIKVMCSRCAEERLRRPAGAGGALAELGEEAVVLDGSGRRSSSGGDRLTGEMLVEPLAGEDVRRGATLLPGSSARGGA